MNILITNDDGIYAKGINILANILLTKKHFLYIVAPDRERSASGHSITMHHPLRVEELQTADDHVLRFSVDGTPSDCVKLAIEALLPETPHLILSGINNGPNLGTDVLYSGTVSAAIEGALSRIPSIAVSVMEDKSECYEYAALFISAFIELLQNKKMLNPELLLNINIPSVNPLDINGIKLTRLGHRLWKNAFEKHTDPRGKTYYWMAGDPYDFEEDDDVDLVAIKNNYISVSPLHFNLSSEALQKKLSFLMHDSKELCELITNDKRQNQNRNKAATKRREKREKVES